MSDGLRLSVRMESKAPANGSRAVCAHAWSYALAALLLLCLLVQGTAVQTHLHFIEVAPSSTIASSHGSFQLSRPAKGDSPGDCPLCQEAAMAGAYVLPAAVVLPTPPEAASWIAAWIAPAFDRLTASHAWQSRAPPQ